MRPSAAVPIQYWPPESTTSFIFIGSVGDVALIDDLWQMADSRYALGPTGRPSAVGLFAQIVSSGRPQLP